MNRLVRAIAHALQRFASLLLGLARDEDVESRQRPVRADGSPPPDWLRRMRHGPPRDWVERVRRGRPRWMKGSTPVAPPSPAPVFGPDDNEPSLPTASDEVPTSPHGGGEVARLMTPPGGQPPARSSRGVIAPAPIGRPRKGKEGAGASPPAPGVIFPLPPGEGRVEASIGSPSSPAAADERAVVVQAPSASGGPAQGARKKQIRHQHWFESIRRTGDGGPEAVVAPPIPAHTDEPPLDHLFGLAWPPIEAPWNRGANGAFKAPTPSSPRRGGKDAVSVVAPPAAADLQHQAVYEIEELPFDAGPDDPWPDLPAEAPADEADPVTLWRGWERRERLAREQRGD